MKFFSGVRNAIHALRGKVAESIRRDSIKPSSKPQEPIAKSVAELHPAIRRRMEHKAGRKLQRNAVVMISPEVERDFLSGLMARRAARTFARATFDPGGNAHQRRVRRREAFRALQNKLAAV